MKESMSIPTEVTISVYADADYRYEVSIGEQLQLSYIEGKNVQTIGFGSIDEMKQ